MKKLIKIKEMKIIRRIKDENGRKQKVTILFQLYKNNETVHGFVITKSQYLLSYDFPWVHRVRMQRMSFSTFVEEPLDLDCPYRSTAMRWMLENIR